MTISTDSPKLGPESRIKHSRGRPKRRATINITARLTGRAWQDWSALCTSTPNESSSVLAKKCLLALLAIHLRNDAGAYATVFAELTMSSVWGKPGDRINLCEYLNITPPAGKTSGIVPIGLQSIAGLGAELSKQNHLITVRFSDLWYDRWMTLVQVLPGLPPGQIFAEAVRVGVATKLAAQEGRPRVIINLPDGRTHDLADFLNIK